MSGYFFHLSGYGEKKKKKEVGLRGAQREKSEKTAAPNFALDGSMQAGENYSFDFLGKKKKKETSVGLFPLSPLEWTMALYRIRRGEKGGEN